jgi:hypothetical protein
MLFIQTRRGTGPMILDQLLPRRRRTGSVVTPDDEAKMELPRSKFVREQIRALVFTEASRSYVAELVAIERLVTTKRLTWAGGMLAHALRARHPREYDAIHRELNPDGYEGARRERARRARAARNEALREATAVRRQEERDRRLWAAMS